MKTRRVPTDRRGSKALRPRLPSQAELSEPFLEIPLLSATRGAADLPIAPDLRPRVVDGLRLVGEAKAIYDACPEAMQLGGKTNCAGVEASDKADTAGPKLRESSRKSASLPAQSPETSHALKHDASTGMLDN